jgi:hypothetical protein
MFLREHVCGIVDASVMFQVNLRVSDGFVDSIFLDAKMANILDVCRLGPVNAYLIVVESVCRFGDIVNVKVAEDVAEILRYSCCLIGQFDSKFT